MTKKHPDTHELDEVTPPPAAASQSPIAEESLEYRPVPAASSSLAPVALPRPWRIQLINEAGEAIGLDVFGEAMLGRGELVREHDGVDLTRLGAKDKGVSRAHAILRPTSDSLGVVDAASTNGTFVNAERARSDAPISLADGDVLALGNLLLTVRIIRSPSQQD